MFFDFVPLIAAVSDVTSATQNKTLETAMDTTGPIISENVHHFLPLTILVCLALLVPVSMLLISWFAGKYARVNRDLSDQSKEKHEPFECGIQTAATVGQADERFSVKFYIIGMLFLVFDLEVAFLYPFVIRFKYAEGWDLLWVLLAFLVLLEAGYLYLFRKGALDWEKEV